MILASNGYCATEFTSTINNANEDYNTLTLWESALDGNLTSGSLKCGSWDACSAGTCDMDNMTDGEAVTWDGGSSGGTLYHITNANGGSGGDQYMILISSGSLADDDEVTDATNTFIVAGAPDSCIVVAELFDDEGDLSDNLSIDGSTTSAANYLKITSPIGERHDGTDTGATLNPKLTPISSGRGIYANDPYTVVEWLNITGWFGTDKGAIEIGFDTGPGAPDYIVRNNLIHDNDSGVERPRGIYAQKYTRVNNNIVYGMVTNGSLGYGIQMKDARVAGRVTVYNNTIYNNSGGYGLRVEGTLGDPNAIVKNNISLGNGQPDFSFAADLVTNDYNASGDTTATGTNSVTGITSAIFVNDGSGTEDLHLVSSATSLIDDGVDLGTTAGVNIDIDGRDRDAEGDIWDIGADEYVSIGGVTFIPKIMMF